MSLRSTTPFLLILLLQNAFVRAQHTNGLDPTMDMPMEMASGAMLSYLHFGPGNSDILWFEGWVPQTRGAMVGTCIGLFMLGLLERVVSAMRGVSERAWAEADEQKVLKRTDGKCVGCSSGKVVIPGSRTVPFTLSHDISRAIFQTALGLLHVLFMFTIMTYQAGFILAVVLGLGTGETLFGRFANPAAHLN